MKFQKLTLAAFSRESSLALAVKFFNMIGLANPS